MTAQQPDSPYPEMDTPEFRARANAMIAAEQAKFDAWLAEDKFEDLIVTAKVEAHQAFKDAAGLPEIDDEKTTWAEVDFGHRRGKLLVQALDNSGIGFAEIQTWSWWLNCDHVLGKRRRGHRGTSRQNDAAVEAFALAVSRPGFELRIARE